MDEQRVQGNWKEIKKEVQCLWGDLTEREIESSKGNLHKLVEIVHDKYGEDQKSIEEKMDEFLVKYSPQ